MGQEKGLVQSWTSYPCKHLWGPNSACCLYSAKYVTPLFNLHTGLGKMDCNENEHIFNFPSDVRVALKATTGCTTGIIDSKLCKARTEFLFFFS